MRLWRLSSTRFARSFDGGYGLLFDGRWNSIGRPVTYAATSPSLCVLEKLVHIEDPRLVPSLSFVIYDAPDGLAVKRIGIADLPADWRRRQAVTRAIEDAWMVDNETPLLLVPSAIVPIETSPDMNLLINHRHPEAARITIVDVQPFTLDARLLAP